MDITTATPAEIDTELHRLDVQKQRLSMRSVALTRALRQAEATEAGYGTGYQGPSSADLLAQIKEIELEFVAASQAAIPLRAEFVNRAGWERWYLVPDGHLHYDISGDRCSRIPTTDHYWMTEFSGSTEAEMIELAGDRVCTVCFENAPVAPRPATARFMTPSEAERAAYREQAARIRAAKKANQITTPEGEELHVPRSFGGTDLLKTERSAWNRAMQDATTIAWYGTKDSAAEREAIELCLAALAHRRGVTVESLREELNKKIAAKGKREGFEVLATV